MYIFSINCYNDIPIIFSSFQNALGDTTLMLAIEKGLYNCAKSLLKEKVPVNQTNNEGKTAIHKAIYCSLSGKENCYRSMSNIQVRNRFRVNPKRLYSL